MAISNSKISSIISEEAHKILNERFYTETYLRNLGKKVKEFYTGIEDLDGEPQSASQVMSVNGWTGSVVDKMPNGVIVRCYTKGSTIAGQECDFEDLVDALNDYYRNKNVPIHAEGIENYNNMEGVFLKVTKQ